MLVQQADTKLWGTVGGMVESDESPEEAARREALEEIGVSVEIGSICSVVGGPKYEVVYPNGDKVAYVSTVDNAMVSVGQPTADLGEIASVQWVSLDELRTISLHSFSTGLFTDLKLLNDNGNSSSDC